jgi:CubicO group peptidase (beta-lactamase class C family)
MEPGAAPVFAQEPPPTETLAPFLDSIRVAHGIPGLSFALFNAEGAVFEYSGGLKAATGQDPVGPATVFEAASISKPVFAALVLDLAREGVLDLDERVTPIPEDLDVLAADPRSELLTPRLLLAHLGGLPNWRARMRFEATRYEDMFASDQHLTFRQDPGAGYLYSGEGFVLLQRFVEARTGRTLQDLATERVFGPLGMDRSSFLYDDAMRTDAASGHNRDGEPDKWLLGLALSSSTLHTTATDLAAFGAFLARETGDGGSLEAMAESAVSVGQTGDVSVDWGLGIGIASTPRGRFLYHGGNNVIFIAELLWSEVDQLGYAILTNSANGRQLLEPIQERLFGTSFVP